MPKRKFHGGRALLNLPGFHSTGAIVAEIENTSKWKAGKNAEGDPLDKWNCAPRYTLQLSDCARAINLDLDWYESSDDDGNDENNLHKVDALIDALTKFRAGLAVEIERYRDRQAWVAAQPTDDE